ncbi:RimJ/RimL family protein N-acetyltransferase [Anaerotaenia torta]|uniref:GNAT family N-acetyltransferase n=1 Tax=Anaerotaenia torta TaxID=433293 RepID=UPI003D1D0495
MRTKRLLIRRFLPDDWQDLFEYLSQEEVVKYEPYEVFTEEQSRQEAIRRSERPDFWAVCLQDTGRLIGNVYLAKQEFGTWELGYVFNKNYQGNGYATEAAKALIEDSFENHDAHRVVAMCNPLNTASWKLLERLGLRREGYLKKNIWFFKDENDSPIWQDTYEYAVLKEEWQRQRTGWDGNACDLLQNLDKLHTTKLGAERIKSNLRLNTEDVVKVCRDKIQEASAVINRRGKNWYVDIDGCKITVNAHSYTIITAHREAGEAVSDTR